MRRIGILSDTHGFLHPGVFSFFEHCDEIWHAGDIGSPELIEKLERFKPTRAVWGNIDDHKMRLHLPEKQVFVAEGIKVLIMHIAGKPGKYSREAAASIRQHKPGLLVGGHSHILLVKYDTEANLLFINPGAAGIHGFHPKLTLVRLELDQGGMRNLEIFEAERKTILPDPIG